MSNIQRIYEEITAGKTVYIHDDFHEAVIKILPNGKTYIKRHLEWETEIDSKTKLVFEIEMGGEFVDEEFYNSY